MKLNEYELDALAEVINIGVGRAANALSEITGSRIELTVPNIHICNTNHVHEIFDTNELDLDLTIQQGFGGDLSGQALLTFLSGNAIELAQIVGDIPVAGGDLDEELRGVLEEIGNIVLNSILGSISNLFDCGFTYTLPTLCEKQNIIKKILDPNNNGPNSKSLIVITDTSFKVSNHDISGALLVLFETDDIKQLLSALTAVEAV